MSDTDGTGLLHYYERLLDYTLIPSVFALMAVVFIDELTALSVPRSIFHGLMIYYLMGLLYSWARQARHRREVNA